MTYADEGIVIRRTDFREAERLIILFSKEHGKLILRAPGAKKPTSRKTSHLEIFNRIQFLAAKGKTFDVLIESKILNDFLVLKNNLKQLAEAFYVSELVDHTTREEQENKLVFDLLLEFLKRSDLARQGRTLKTLSGRRETHGASSQRQMRNFETRLLDYLGFWPHDGFEKFDQRDLKEWGSYNKSLIEWVLEGSLKSEGFMNSLSSLRSDLAEQGPTF